MNDYFRNTSEAYKERFINAESNYKRYLVLKDLLSWVQDLHELNDRKDERIARLQKEIKGYNLEEYIDDAD